MSRAIAALLAPAKINLALHVVGRRADGYHLLDSLVVFAELGDRLRLSLASATTFSVCGPFAAAMPAGADNLVPRAARLAGQEAAMELCKALPVGAGIGGGSSDAAAVLRGLAALSGATPPDALPLGADVPACLLARPARMRGIGEVLEPLPPLPELPMVLIHPGVAVSTGAVFASLHDDALAPLPDAIPHWRTAAEAAGWLRLQRNDLEPAAIRVAPVIGAARSALEAQPACLLARMSGSGSTVFGIFPTADAATEAAARLSSAYPDWWVRATGILAEAPEVQVMRDTT